MFESLFGTLMMRRFFLLCLIVLSLDSLAIKPILVKFTCNLRTINKQEGDNRTQWTLNDKDCGWCFVYKSKHPKELVGHNGLFIYLKPYTYEYRVYDLKCPVCDKKKINSSIEMENSVEAICKKCETRFDIFNVGSPLNNIEAACEGLWLESYTYNLEGDIMIIDSSPGLEQRQMLWGNE